MSLSDKGSIDYPQGQTPCHTRYRKGKARRGPSSSAVASYGFKSDFLLMEFQGKWEVLILPLLSTHMALTFISKGIEMAAEKIDGEE
jgi:hypothetical protein